jgi:hypothetical protein
MQEGTETGLTAGTRSEKMKMGGLDKGLLITGAVSGAAGIGLGIWNRLVLGDVREDVRDVADVQDKIMAKAAAIQARVSATPDMVTERVLSLTREFTRLGSSNDAISSLERGQQRLEQQIAMMTAAEGEPAAKQVLAGLQTEVGAMGEHLKVHAASLAAGQENLARAYDSASQTARRVEELNELEDEDEDEDRKKDRKKGKKRKRSRRR